MKALKKGDYVLIIPSERQCKEIKELLGKVQRISGVDKDAARYHYRLKNVMHPSGLPFIFEEWEIELYNPQLLFTWEND